MAKKMDVTPYNISNVECGHEVEYCTFNTLVKKYRLENPSLHIMAKILAGAATVISYLVG